MPYLKNLNPTQREAVTHDSGPLLILAGAGSGKTRVLTTRIAHLIRDKGVAPENILAVTFTNKASKEMRVRLKALIGDKAKHLWLGTFHSLGLRMLKEHTHLLGKGSHITVYDNDDQLRLVKSVMDTLNISIKATSPKAILNRINQAKNEDIAPSDYLEFHSDFFSKRVSDIYTIYQKKLAEMSALDFGDLICMPLKLFKEHPNVLEAYKVRFEHILIDEYQDTNKAQYMMMDMLAKGHRNLSAVGDPDQSIYGWRGADISNILGFTGDWGDATVLRLEQNYRSTGSILKAANAVIENNSDRYEKNLWTENPEGELPIYEECADEKEEARKVSSIIGLGVSRGRSYKDFAIFYRTNAQSRTIEEQFIRSSIPYAIVGGVRFYERKEVRDALSYLKTVVNPLDSISLKRIINTPARGIGAVTLKAAEKLSEERGIPLYEAFKGALEQRVLRKPALATLIKAIDKAREDLLKVPPHEIAMRLMEESGYLDMYEKEGTEEAMARVENIHEFISAIRDYENYGTAENDIPTLANFLEEVSLINDTDSYEDNANRVTLMTIHSAKGLEFPVALIIGMEESLFPHARSLDSPDEMEEERRLCYVAMTRAMERLYMFSARTRNVYGETRYQSASRFIDEIPINMIELKGDNPGFGSARGQGREYRDDSYLDSISVPNDGERHYIADDSQANPYSEDVYSEEDSHSSDTLRIGMKVEHPSFGLGIIQARQGTGEDAKLTIKFQRIGIKKLIAKYASLTEAGV